MKLQNGYVEIPNYPGYIINDSGVIISKYTGKRLRTQIQNSGYELCHLYKDGKRKALTVHRIVAIIFVANPNEKDQVNHKNGNKTDNRAINLEWVSRKENMRHAVEKGMMDNAAEKARLRMKDIGSKYAKQNGDFLRELSKKTSKPIIQLDMDGNFVNEYPSINEARRKVGNFGISKAASGEYKQAGGYKWVLKSSYLQA